jgi:NAD(P)-dependent dehydrogenase (short-subunit alcohol dehydrogenase family)
MAGIGLAIARSLAREGARVIVNGRTTEGVRGAVESIRERTEVDVYEFVGDMSPAEAVEELARRHADVEILVNNLGIFEPKKFAAITDSDWRRFFEVKCDERGPTGAALPARRARAGHRVIPGASTSSF